MKKLLFILLVCSLTAQGQMELPPAPQLNQMETVQNYQLKASAAAMAGIGGLAYLSANDFPLIPALSMLGVATIYAIQSGVAWKDVNLGNRYSDNWRQHQMPGNSIDLAYTPILAVKIPVRWEKIKTN